MSKPLHLRPVVDTDLPIFFRNQSDREASEIAMVPVHDQDAFTAHWAKRLADPQVLIRTSVFNEEVAGNVLSFERVGVRWVGYWTGRSYWGQGVATRALSAFLPLETIRPLFAAVAQLNVASARVVQKCGLVHCGQDGAYLLFTLV